ncbi:MAG: FecR family protein [Woeseiaceae bacterium]|nr:FecR family protein [Woeseiaceae bacterium]
MTNTGDNSVRDGDQALEQLLGQAGPRPMPSPDGVQRARREVRREWQVATRKRTRRRRLGFLAAAATVAAGVSVAWFVWLAPVADPPQVATIDRSAGTIYLAGEQSQLTEAQNLDVVRSGQTIVTGDEGRVGLTWLSGGSLRLDENTRVTFTSDETLTLVRGRVYFDSQTDVDADSSLTIATQHGDVTHVGTQYMTEVDGDELIVSVREGRVAIEGVYHSDVAAAGKQVRLAGRSTPEVVDIRVFGEDWQWVEVTAPAPALQGRKLVELIAWVSRETGLKVRFASDAVAAMVADGETASGSLGDSPRDALKISLVANDLDYTITDSGEIVISQAGQ